MVRTRSQWLNLGYRLKDEGLQPVIINNHHLYEREQVIPVNTGKPLRVIDITGDVIIETNNIDDYEEIIASVLFDDSIKHYTIRGIKPLLVNTKLLLSNTGWEILGFICTSEYLKIPGLKNRYYRFQDVKPCDRKPNEPKVIKLADTFYAYLNKDELVIK